MDSQLQFYLVTYIHSRNARPFVAFTDPISHPCHCLFHPLVSMAMLGTEQLLTILSSQALAVGPGEGFFFVEDLQFYYMLKLWVYY